MRESAQPHWGWGAGGSGAGRREKVLPRDSTLRALADIELCDSVEEFARLCAKSEARHDLVVR